MGRSVSSPPADPADDERMMRYALQLGERGVGRTWPNPSVGCVLVKDGHILAAARTANGGRPHAETLALQQATESVAGATAYVTLEPCAHYGVTPPCAEALAEAGIRRVVIGCVDSDERVRGQGIALLEQAGVTVTTGVLEAEACRSHAGFFSRLHRNRPFTALKLATSLDGRITNAQGQSQWITGEAARIHAHSLRARYDAILTGIGTVLADDPALTCRVAGLETCSPVRVVLDTQLRLPPDSQLARSARDVPLWLLTAAQDAEKIAVLEAQGVRVTSLAAGADGHIPLPAMLEWLAQQGITRLLCEAGATLAGAIWHEGLADRLYWYRAPVVLGDKGMAALAITENTPPSALTRLQREDTIALGSDLLETYSTGEF